MGDMNYKPVPYEVRRLGYLDASGKGNSQEAVTLRAKVREMIADGRISPNSESPQMSQTYSLEFHNVTAEVYRKLAGQLATAAKITTDPNGDLTISGQGIEAEAHYDAYALTVTVLILDRPWYLTVAAIRQYIESALEKALDTKTAR
jgi:hypothetical protein